MSATRIEEDITVTQRIDYTARSPKLFKKLLDLSMALSQDSTIEPEIHHLVQLRASQLNGCGFCVDMHAKEARLHGERELRLHHVVIWRESTLFSPRERAALAWTEALTQLGPEGVPDALYDKVRTQFDEKELSDLSFAVATINAWNRMSIGFRAVPGSRDALLGLDKAGLA
jgi:AhpD family alkylhydroperoxidase